MTNLLYGLTFLYRSARPWFGSTKERRRSAPTERVLRHEDLGRLAALGIHADGLTGRLRLVLPVGCYGDFRFTRDILSTGAAREETDLAIDVLMHLGASCDCQVIQVLGQLPRGILWHHKAAASIPR